MAMPTNSTDITWSSSTTTVLYDNYTYMVSAAEVQRLRDELHSAMGLVSEKDLEIKDYMLKIAKLEREKQELKSIIDRRKKEYVELLGSVEL